MNHFNRAFGFFAVLLTLATSGCPTSNQPDTGVRRDAFATDVRFTDPDTGATTSDAFSAPDTNTMQSREDASVDAFTQTDGAASRDAFASADAAGSCATNRDCTGPGMFCEAASCGARGVCALRPDLCPGVVAPVCGCDGRTYNNACLAGAAGVNVARASACGATCTANSECRVGSYCAGTGCGTAGTCAPMPEFCADIFAPVCGCDGRTYSNECSAEGAGVRVRSVGACRASTCEPGGTCGRPLLCEPCADGTFQCLARGETC